MTKEYTLITGGGDELSKLYKYDEQKFRGGYSSNLQTANQSQLAGKLIFAAHSIEKSLSNDHFEAGRAVKNVRDAIDIIRQYKRSGYDQDYLAYISTLSTLKAYYERHKGTEFIDGIRDIFGEVHEEIISCESNIGGSSKVLLNEKKNNHKKNFKELSEGRFAVRTYSNTPVDREWVRDAVQIAMKTPTVCNRQSIHVYEMYDKKVIEAVLKVQGGIVHYDTPPALLLITADDNGYVGANERNQGFIDGGSFAMSMLYALEYKKLAACPLNAMFNEVKEKAIRGMLDLSDSEKLITFISVGHFKDENNVCKSFRYSADQILSEKKTIHNYTIKNPDQQVSSSNNQDSLLIWIRKKVRVRTRIRQLKSKVRIRTRIRAVLRKLYDRKEAKLLRGIINKSDGGILTLNGFFNYGNILQRYALQRYVYNHGYSFTSLEKGPLDKRPDTTGRMEYTKKFVDNRIACVPLEGQDNLDTYIVGSDQVWRRWGEGEENNPYRDLKDYMFNFVRNKKSNRIAYAASFGCEKIEDARLTPEIMDELRPLAQRIDHVSVREMSAVDIAQKYWGIEAELVVDPVFLLDKKHYSKLIRYYTSEVRPSKPIFGYLLDASVFKKDAINRIVTSPSEIYYLNHLQKLPPVEQWLKNICDANLVVTDSFHGVAFSLIFNTPFVVLENTYGGVSRMESLLALVGLDHLFISNDQLESIESFEIPEIDWKSVNDKLRAEIERSESWLLKALEGRDN